MRRKIVVLVIAVVGFLFCTKRRCSTRAAPSGSRSRRADLQPRQPAAFRRDGVLQGQTTASGVAARTGVAAADPTLLPVGSVVNIAAGDARYSGVYTVMDTGPRVQGRVLDLYMWSCHEALKLWPQGSPGHRASARMGSDGELARPRSTACSDVAKPRDAFLRPIRRRPRALHPRASTFGSDSGGRHLPRRRKRPPTQSRLVLKPVSSKRAAVPDSTAPPVGYAVVESN